LKKELSGSPHDWFEERGPRCTLLVFYVKKNGIPGMFYTDFGSVFHVNLNNQENDKKTHWEKACTELHIKVQHAHSPQAKGRVERCNQTMQDRLPKELKLAGIDSMEAANDFLRNSSFIADHNRRFAKLAAQKGDAHASIEGLDLDDIFTIQEERVLANDYTIVHQKHIFQLSQQQKPFLGQKILLLLKPI